MPNQPKEYGIELRDFLRTFEGGVNAGVAPQLIPKSQLANGINTTVRGDFVGVRPYFRKMQLDYGGNTTLQHKVETFLFQDAQFYQPDNGPESLMTSQAGNLFRFVIGTDTATVTNITGSESQSPTAQKCWLWQSENFMNWQDGSSNPVRFNGTATVRSLYGTIVHHATTVASDFTVNAPGTPTLGVAMTSNASMQVGDLLSFTDIGAMTVLTVDGGGSLVDLMNTNIRTGITIAALTGVEWNNLSSRGLPPGRMGVYGMGRNWLSLVDGRQFVASDIVGGSSGTASLGFRDAVQNITENSFLAGGGNFAIPGSYGQIRAMCFASTLDASLGQGPLQIFTPTGVFSCQTPLDRLTWQDVTNPILTQSLIAGGSLSHDATIAVNGDTIMRCTEGLRSLILARREFSTWGNVPISLEVDPVLAGDDADLLGFCSAIVFNNRFLVTAGPVPTPQGVYWRGLIPLNFDPISTLRGKQPSVYDSVTWTGLNIFKVVVGHFAGIERAFAFTYNTVDQVMELWEILPTVRTELGQKPTVITDSGKRVTWRIESPTLFKPVGEDYRRHDYLRLGNGEIYVDELQGTVDFQAWFKPDQWPCWIPWVKWSECAGVDSATSQPQFRPRMGLGEPSIEFCDPITNRPMCEGYTFQIALEVTGHCSFKGATFFAYTIPEPPPQPVCLPICQN